MCLIPPSTVLRKKAGGTSQILSYPLSNFIIPPAYATYEYMPDAKDRKHLKNLIIQIVLPLPCTQPSYFNESVLLR